MSLRQIDGETRLVGLIGNGTHYTLSPAIHNASIRELTLNYVYVNFDIHAQDIEAFLRGFIACGGRYLNVTKPFKSIIPKMLGLDPIRSVNTLKYDDASKRWHGCSTDGAGFMRGLRNLAGNQYEPSTILIFGCGGAAESVLTAMSCDERFNKKSFAIVARRKDVFDQLASSFKDLNVTYIPWNAADLEAYFANCGLNPLVIQASSAPQSGDSMAEFLNVIRASRGVFIDLIYDRPSQLYFEAMNQNWLVQDGLPMLVEQARLSQEFWWGKAGSYDCIFRALKDTGRFK